MNPRGGPPRALSAAELLALVRSKGGPAGLPAPYSPSAPPPRGLPTMLHDWPEDAREELRERAAFVWEGRKGSTEADWSAAQEAATEMVRRHWSTRLLTTPAE